MSKNNTLTVAKNANNGEFYMQYSDIQKGINTCLDYAPATGHLASMLANGSDTPFAWSYLPGSDKPSPDAIPLDTPQEEEHSDGR